MSEVSVGKLLPNLTVRTDNDSPKTDSSDVKDVSMKSKVEIVRPSGFTYLQNPKLYFNKDGGFPTGIDLLEQEKSGILSRRAKRFGINSDIKQSISALYESMGIDINNRDSPQMKRIRLDAIHLRGVEELDTDDIFLYFQDYGPSHIEWINDCSCNLLFSDEETCARALQGLSKPLPTPIPSELIGSEKSEKEDPDLTALKLDDKEESMDIDSASKCEIPVPPGVWRLGVPHDLAKTILLRFANIDDKKVPGAEKRSKYYKKYGNPNYGGLKGLISSSRKHRVQAAANRWAVEQGSSSHKSFQESEPSVPRVSKPIRMRMYADDEEVKAKKKRYSSHFSDKKQSVHSRLGKKYTSDDLCYLGSYRDSDDYDDKMPSDFHDSKPNSTLDLRFKIKNRNVSHKASSSVQYGQRSVEDRNKSYDRMKYKRVNEIKRNYRSVYKRKYRSPLCEDDNDDDDDGSSSDDFSS